MTGTGWRRIKNGNDGRDMNPASGLEALVSGGDVRPWLFCCVCILYSVYLYICMVSRSLSVPCSLLGRCIARS